MRVGVPANGHRTVVPRLSILSDTHEASVNDAMETQYNYMRYIGRKCSRAFKTCTMCAPGRAPLSAQVMPSISKRGKKKKIGADATTNRTAVGQSLASNHARPLD